MADYSMFVPNVHFEQIPIKNLVSNQEYQRNISEQHVLNAAAHFDLYQINPVKVSRRNGVSSFAGEPTSNVGKNFLRSYAGVCLQGVVIALACIIFSAVSSSPPAVDTSVSVVTAVWTYVGELAFNLLVLVGAVKGCDRIVKEIMGL